MKENLRAQARPEWEPSGQPQNAARRDICPAWLH